MQTLLVFTDLDGTLLDAHSFSWEPARPAVAALLASGALLVPSSSKTRSELLPLQASLGTQEAAIVENGAALFGATDRLRPAGAVETVGRGWELSLGPEHERVLQALDIIASNLDVEIFPLSRMTETEAEEATGLEGDELRAARQRLHTEPFLAPAARLEDLQAAAQELDLDVTAGGRFFNIGGGQDKGEAVRLLTAACVGEGSAVVTVGLGDSLNDASLLLAVDYPILIPKPGGVHDPLVLGASVRLCLADLPGPSGWATAIHTILECWESGALSDRTERRKP